VGKDEMRARLSEARVGRLATVRADGRPHVVPYCFVLDGDAVVTAVDDAKAKTTLHLQRLDNIGANSAASVLVDHYDEDWSQLWWVRVDGDATVSGDQHAIDLLQDKYPQYRDRRPPGPVIRIEITSWRGWKS
jgi:PPOX class probable F420-dependent enzyme